MNAKAMAAWITTPPTKATELPAINNYLLTQAGIVNYRQLPYGVSIELLDGEPLIKGPDITIPKAPEFKLHLVTPRIPWAVYAQVVSFFRAVYDEHKAEAIIRVFYDQPNDAWIPHCPEQAVTGAHVSHKDDFDAGGKLMHVCDIHSHNTMSAFFSTTDDEDEKKAVRLYGVVGLINQPIPASSWRAWTGKKFIDLALLDVVAAPPDITMPIEFPIANFLKDKAGIKDVVLTSTKEFTTKLFGDFPAEWMKKVSKPSYVSNGRGSHQGTFYGGYGDGWDESGHMGTVGFGGGPTHRGFRGRDHVDIKTTDRRHHANKGNKPGKTGSGVASDANDTAPNPGASLIDLEGPEADIIPVVSITAMDTSKVVYLIDRKTESVWRVLPHGKVQRRNFSLHELWKIKETKQTTETLVYAVPEFTKHEKGGN